MHRAAACIAKITGTVDANRVEDGLTQASFVLTERTRGRTSGPARPNQPLLERTQHVAAGAGNGERPARMREGVMPAQYVLGHQS